MRKLKHRFSDRTLKIRPSGIRQLFDLAQKMGSVISLGIGEPDFDTPNHIKEEAKRAMDEGYTHYTPNSGFFELREAISKKVKTDNNLDYSPNDVIVSDGGCTGSILLSILALVNPGEEVIISDPCFVVYEAIVRIVGAKPVFVRIEEEDDFRLLSENVEKVITSKTKVIIINSPCNPTGGVQRREDLEGIADLADKNNLYVISDEVYEKMLYDGMKHYSIASIQGMRNRTLTVNALSKTYAMTGWRIGYTVGDKEIIDQMVKLQQFTMVHAPSISQRAAIVALKGSQDSVKEMTAEFDKRRQFMVKRLNEIDGFRCPTPKGAFYVFPNIQGFGKTSLEFAEILLQEGGVVALPGTIFGENGEGYMRFSYTQPLERLEEACNRIETVANKLV